LVVADASGVLHLFCVQGVAGAVPEQPSILYVAGTHQGWSEPIDILVSPEGSELYLRAVELDSEGHLHVLWCDRWTLYHSVAHVAEAADARHWETVPILSGSIPIADMVQDTDGTLHAVVRVDFSSVGYVQSKDSGKSWSEPHVIIRTVDTVRFAVEDVGLALSSSEALHMTWSVAAAEVQWQFWSVGYGRSKDSGRTWELIEDVASPLFGASDVFVDAEDNVHLVWGRNISNPDGRWHQWSDDDGTTWSRPVRLFPGYYASGDTGGYGIALDSDGTLHLVNSIGGGREGKASAYHLRWEGDHWSEPVFLMSRHAHFARIAVTLGNHLHFFAHAEGGIWYMQRTIDAPPTKAVLVPVPAIMTNDYTRTPTPVLTLIPTPVSTFSAPPLDVAQIESVSVLSAPLVMSMVLTLMLILSLVGLRRFLWKR
jgi:hypothetical protein